MLHFILQRQQQWMYCMCVTQASCLLIWRLIFVNQTSELTLLAESACVQTESCTWFKAPARLWYLHRRGRQELPTVPEVSTSLKGRLWMSRGPFGSRWKWRTRSWHVLGVIEKLTLQNLTLFCFSCNAEETGLSSFFTRSFFFFLRLYHLFSWKESLYMKKKDCCHSLYNTSPNTHTCVFSAASRRRHRAGNGT